MLWRRTYFAGNQLRILSQINNSYSINGIARHHSSNPQRKENGDGMEKDESGDLKDKVKQWITTLNENDQRKVRYCQNEMHLNVLQSPESAPDPDVLAIADYRKLLELSNNQRKRHYRYLFKNQSVTKDNQLEKKIARSVHKDNTNQLAGRNKVAEEIRQKYLEYGLGKNSILLRFNNQTVTRWKHQRLFYEMTFSPQQLMFDCSFDNDMTYHESKTTAEAISKCFHRNRDHNNPFVMNLYNLNPHGSLHRNLNHYIRGFGSPEVPIQIHHDNYIDHMAKESICVITNEAAEELTEFDPNTNYVLGGIHKLANRNPFMHIRAKQIGLRTVRLPFDRYRNFRYHKNLPLDQMIQILLEFRVSRDWNRAFEFIDRHVLK